MVAKTETQKPGFGQIARQGAIGGGIGIVINTILFFIGSALGAFPPDALTPMGMALNITIILAASVVAPVAAIIVYFVLTRVLSTDRAKQIFVILAVLILLVMGSGPFGITNVPAFQIVLLEAMHLVSGGTLVYLLMKA